MNEKKKTIKSVYANGMLESDGNLVLVRLCVCDRLFFIRIESYLRD